MKILIISNMYPSKEKPYSGIFVKNQYEYLKHNLNQDIDIYTMKRTFTSKFGSFFKYFKFFLGFSSSLFKKYDVIHVHYFFPIVLLAIIYKFFHPSSKVVVTFHGSDITNFIKSKFSKYFFKKIINKCDYIISVGVDLSNLIFEKLDKKVDLILSAGIDKNKFYYMENIDKEYDFIFVGSFISRKGVDILEESIGILNNKNIKYIFIGSGKLEKNIKSIMKNYSITLMYNKSQDELRKLYNKSKFFILPSRDEPFGLVVSEAIFCGTPAIISNIGGMKEQVADGYNGFIIEENTPECLAKKMEEVLKIEAPNYKKLQQNCINSNEEYSLNNICNKLLDIYKELLNEK